ncbi:MAG: ABC transporter ATP-binding protein [Vicinamibacterales bacterium]
MSVAIRAQGLGKKYKLGTREPYGTLRDSLTRLVTSPFRGRRPANGKWLWALNDVSFEVQNGQVLGVIGRNGSGKSTLLKLLSRITEPTSGWAEVHGRVGSLLEVGTGFHPELTGRENVFVNGAILGMSGQEIGRKFDEIVAFADLETFIDTPVKHYSSGMHMRLAFAVAAHLEPEILLVDEVLAVGDLAFQRKCLGKMDDVSKHGRTILFVSHQLNQLRRLCTHCIWLESGRLIDAGPANELINRYEASFMERPSELVDQGAGTAFLKWTLGDSESSEHTLGTFGPFTLRILMRVDERVVNGHHGIALRDAENRVMWGTNTDNLKLEPGLHEIVYEIDSLPLRPGAYRWLVSLYDGGRFINSLDCIPDLIIDTPPLGHRQDDWAGVLNLPHSVTFQPASMPSRPTAVGSGTRA